MRWAALAAGALVLAPGCRPAPQRTDAGAVHVRATPSGCGAVRLVGQELACELPESRAVRVLVEAQDGATPTATSVHAGDAACSATETRGLFTCVVPPGAGRIVARATTAQGNGEAVVALREPEVDPDLAAIAAARRSGALDDVGARVRAADALPRMRPGVAARARGELARAELAAGETKAAVAGLRAALAAAKTEGWVSDAVHDGLAAAYALILVERDLGEARAALGEIAPLLASYPDGAAEAPYYLALLAEQTGDLGAALAHAEDAEARASRLGLDRIVRVARELSAALLLQLGREPQARAKLAAAEAALRADSPPCDRANLRNNVGWHELSAFPDDDAVTPSPSPALAAARSALEQALALYETTCKRPQMLTNVRINLARVALLDGRPADARALLDEASKTRKDAREQAWILDLRGRAELHEGHAAALATYARLAELAESAALPGFAWRAALGQGEALEARGRLDAAAAAYERAEDRLDELMQVAPLDARTSFLAGHERSARLLVDLRLRRDTPARALDAARRARARVLAAATWTDRVGALSQTDRAAWDGALSRYRRGRDALDEAAAGDWKLSRERLADAHRERAGRERELALSLDAALALLPRVTAGALPALPQGSLSVLVFPRRRGAVVLAADAEGVTAHALDEPTRLAERSVAGLEAAVATLEPRIRRATELRVLAYGRTRDVDVHALLLRGVPLYAALPVPIVYALDVAPRAAGPAAQATRGALVVGDPRGDLPAARAEAAAVASRLGAELLHGTQATRATLLEASPRRELLHYAGHGTFRTGGVASALSLADDAELTAGDVLALPGAPRLVVLSGCETARTEAGPLEGIGLAQAFVMAGASAVVASSRTIDDRLGAALMEALYAARADAGAATSPAVLLARAQTALVDRGDVAAFRVITPLAHRTG